MRNSSKCAPAHSFNNIKVQYSLKLHCYAYGKNCRYIVQSSPMAIEWLKLASCATPFGFCPSGVDLSKPKRTVAWFALGYKPLLSGDTDGSI